QAEDGIRDFHVTGVQTCALPILVDKVWPFPVLIVALVLLLAAAARLTGVPQSSTPLMAAIGALLICIPFGTPALFFFGSRLTAQIGRASCREERQLTVGGGAVHI